MPVGDFARTRRHGTLQHVVVKAANETRVVAAMIAIILVRTDDQRQQAEFRHALAQNIDPVVFAGRFRAAAEIVLVNSFHHVAAVLGRQHESHHDRILRLPGGEPAAPIVNLRRSGQASKDVGVKV